MMWLSGHRRLRCAFGSFAASFCALLLQPRRSALKSLTLKKVIAHVIAISVIRVSAACPEFHVVMRADGAEDDANANMSENLVRIWRRSGCSDGSRPPVHCRPVIVGQ